MEKVFSILSRKYPQFNTISPDCLLTEALSKMTCENVDYLIVTDGNNNFLGLLSEHDIIGKITSSEKSIQSITVNEMMNTHLPVADISDSVEGCMKMMRQHDTRFIPVFQDYTFMGIVSSEDILQEAVYHRGEIFDAFPAEPPVLA